MDEREKVMCGLECCYNDNCGACPYVAIGKCQHELHKDALDLLNERAQQPHSKKLFTVIDKKTGKEADARNIAFHEEWALEQGLIYCSIDGFALLQDGTMLLCDRCGNTAVCEPERFEVVWDE